MTNNKNRLKFLLTTVALFNSNEAFASALAENFLQTANFAKEGTIEEKITAADNRIKKINQAILANKDRIENKKKELQTEAHAASGVPTPPPAPKLETKPVPAPKPAPRPAAAPKPVSAASIDVMDGIKNFKKESLKPAQDRLLAPETPEPPTFLDDIKGFDTSTLKASEGRTLAPKPVVKKDDLRDGVTSRRKNIQSDDDFDAQEYDTEEKHEIVQEKVAVLEVPKKNGKDSEDNEKVKKFALYNNGKFKLTKKVDLNATGQDLLNTLYTAILSGDKGTINLLVKQTIVTKIDTGKKDDFDDPIVEIHETPKITDSQIDEVIKAAQDTARKFIDEEAFSKVIKSNGDLAKSRTNNTFSLIKNGDELNISNLISREAKAGVKAAKPLIPANIGSVKERFGGAFTHLENHLSGNTEVEKEPVQVGKLSDNHSHALNKISGFFLGDTANVQKESVQVGKLSDNHGHALDNMKKFFSGDTANVQKKEQPIGNAKQKFGDVYKALEKNLKLNSENVSLVSLPGNPSINISGRVPQSHEVKIDANGVPVPPPAPPAPAVHRVVTTPPPALPVYRESADSAPRAPLHAPNPASTKFVDFASDTAVLTEPLAVSTSKLPEMTLSKPLLSTPAAASDPVASPASSHTTVKKAPFSIIITPAHSKPSVSSAPAGGGSGVHPAASAPAGGFTPPAPSVASSSGSLKASTFTVSTFTTPKPIKPIFVLSGSGSAPAGAAAAASSTPAAVVVTPAPTPATPVVVVAPAPAAPVGLPVAAAAPLTPGMLGFVIPVAPPVVVAPAPAAAGVGGGAPAAPVGLPVAAAAPLTPGMLGFVIPVAPPVVVAPAPAAAGVGGGGAAPAPAPAPAGVGGGAPVVAPAPVGGPVVAGGLVVAGALPPAPPAGAGALPAAPSKSSVSTAVAKTLANLIADINKKLAESGNGTAANQNKVLEIINSYDTETINAVKENALSDDNQRPLSSEEGKILYTLVSADADKGQKQNNLNNIVGQNIQQVIQQAAFAAQNAISGQMNQIGVAAGDDDKSLLKSVWVKGLYGQSTQGSYKGGAGYRSSLAGGSIGIDFGNENNTLGLAYGNVGSVFKYKGGNAGDKVNSTNNVISLYNSHNIGNFVIQGIFSFIDSKIRLKHAKPEVNRSTQAKTKGRGYSIDGNIGYKIAVTDDSFIIPNLGLAYSGYKTGSYTEKGSGILNRTIGSKNDSMLIGKVGVKAVWVNKLNENTVITPGLHIGVEQYLNNKVQKPSIKLAQLNQYIDTSAATKVKLPSATLNLGGSVIARYKNLEMELNYNCRLRQKYVDNQGAVKLKILF